MQSAPDSRQITTPTAHQLIFTGRMLLQMSNQQCQKMKANYTTLGALLLFPLFALYSAIDNDGIAATAAACCYAK